MAAKWRSRFAEHRLDGLTDEPRPGRPRTITDEQVDAVITKTLESTPRDATHWSTRLMAREVGLTQTAVSRIWRAFGLRVSDELCVRPWRLVDGGVLAGEAVSEVDLQGGAGALSRCGCAATWRRL